MAENGCQAIKSVAEALLAEEQNVDLVEIAPLRTRRSAS